METIQIGNIEWSTTNVSLTTFNDGSPIAMAKNMEEWNALCKAQKPCCCAYDFDDKNVKKFGLIYNPFVIIEADRFCPAGWQIASRADWDALLESLGGNIPKDKNTPSEAIVKLKAEKGWLSKMNGTNESGFNALPGGDLFIGNSFRDKGYGIVWWSAEFHQPHITQYDKNKFKFHEGTKEEGLKSPNGWNSGAYIRFVKK